MAADDHRRQPTVSCFRLHRLRRPPASTPGRLGGLRWVLGDDCRCEKGDGEEATGVTPCRHASVRAPSSRERYKFSLGR